MEKEQEPKPSAGIHVSLLSRDKLLNQNATASRSNSSSKRGSKAKSKGRNTRTSSTSPTKQPLPIEQLKESKEVSTPFKKDIRKVQNEPGILIHQIKPTNSTTKEEDGKATASRSNSPSKRGSKQHKQVKELMPKSGNPIKEKGHKLNFDDKELFDNPIREITKILYSDQSDEEFSEGNHEKERVLKGKISQKKDENALKEKLKDLIISSELSSDIKSLLLSNLLFEELYNFDVQISKDIITFKNETNLLSELRTVHMPISYFCKMPYNHFRHFYINTYTDNAFKISGSDFLTFIEKYASTYEGLFSKDSTIFMKDDKEFLQSFIKNIKLINNIEANYEIQLPKLSIKTSYLDFCLRKQKNWFSDGIRLDLIIRNFATRETFRKAFHISQKIEESFNFNNLLDFFPKFQSNPNVLFTIIHAMNQHKISFLNEYEDIYLYLNNKFDDFQNFLQKKITEFIELLTQIKRRATLKQLNYSEVSEIMFLFRFIFKNLHYPYNCFIDIHPYQKQYIRIIFHEFFVFSSITKLLPNIFSELIVGQIPFSEGEFYLIDLLGHKTVFKKSQRDETQLDCCSGDVHIETFRFNYFQNVILGNEIYDEVYNNPYLTFGNYKMKFVEKSSGSTEGFIIRITDHKNVVLHNIFCKQLFCFSSNFVYALQDRIKVVGGKSNMPEINLSSSYYRTLTITLGNQSLYMLYHNDPIIEMFGYSLLKALEMCPNFIFHRSIFDFKTYILMNEVDKKYAFYEVKNLKKTVNNYSQIQIFNSLKVIHNMKIIHGIFLLNDFHDENYALYIQSNQVESISIIDLWPCPIFLPVYELFRPAMYTHIRSNLELFYNIFYENFPNKRQIMLNKINYECFSKIIKLLFQKVQLDDKIEIIGKKFISCLIVDAFVNQNFNYFIQNDLLSVQTNKDVMKIYRKHTSFNVKKFIEYFVKENGETIIDKEYRKFILLKPRKEKPKDFIEFINAILAAHSKIDFVRIYISKYFNNDVYEPSEYGYQTLDLLYLIDDFESHIFTLDVICQVFKNNKIRFNVMNMPKILRD